MQQPVDMKRPARIVILDRATLPPAVRLRAPAFPHDLRTYDASAASDVAARIADADIVVTNKCPIDAHAVSQAASLKLIAVAATGYDNIDIAACAARGVTVSNIREYAINTVPEHTFALILMLRRSLIEYRSSVQEGRWEKSGQFCYFDYPIHDLAGATLGVIGDGAIGQAVAGLGKAFGMRVLYAAYKGTSGMGPLYTSFEDVMRQSDVITLHCPLLPSTRNMIGAREFALMERRPLLINTARGGLVDEIALRDALTSGRVAGAAFDVATVEPPGPGHPLVKLLDQPNFILTPHIAWASAEATQALVDQLVENIESFWSGKPRNVVA
jgi:glycerate dehydrogenase